MIQLTKPGIAAKLIITFIIIGSTAALLLSIVGTSFLKAALFDSLDTKSKLLTTYLAHELVEPVTLGDYDRMQSLIKSAQKLDGSLSYASVVTDDGRVLASTDISVKNIKLNRDSFERSALKVRGFSKTQTKYSNIFETAMPLNLPEGEERTILRAGYSTSAAEAQIVELVLSFIGLQLLILLAGGAVYSFMTRKTIIQPLSRVARLAAKISQGDLSETLYSNRSDEIGCLIRAEADMVENLRKIASVADEIADGNLSVRIDVHSEKDVFGKALEKMVKSLNSRIKEARKLAAIVEYSEDAIFSISADGGVLSWNNGAEKLLGYEASEILGQKLNIFFPDESREEIFSLVDLVFHSHPMATYESINVRKDGSHVDVALSISQVKDHADRVVAVSIIARDITHKKIVEQRMREFYGIISHELRTPLTSILGALSLLESGVIEANSEVGAELISTAKMSSERLNRLISDILDLRKIESGNLELDIETADSTVLIESAVNSMQGLARDRQINIATKLTNRCFLAVDRDRVTQVITNLISNAIKYSDKEGSVLVYDEQPSNPAMLRVSIQDNGPGIPTESQPKLFQKFMQVDSSDTRAKEGSGLGLAICKAIVEEHGGTIGLASQEGAGSTFWFELPQIDDTMKQVLEAQLMAARNPDRKPLALVLNGESANVRS
jgi:PAS domain S-box-containing protein